jgi:uncharacterized protein (TIGR03435 family)
MTKARIAAISVLLWAVGGIAQTPAPAFEVASVKPSKAPAGHSGWHSRTGYVVLQNQTLKQLVQIAYHVKANQVSGGPKWCDSDRFDIEAKSDGPANDAQLLTMLQTLLADRFQLAFHRETALFPGFALVVAKSGFKIRPVDAGEGERSNSNRGHYTAERVSMAKFAETLSRILRSPVVDRTGTTGVFSFQLEWTPDNADAPAPDGTTPDMSNSGPSLYTVLQERLGVKLEAQKVSAEVLVIDRAEKPTEN